MDQSVKCLQCRHENLSSIPSTCVKKARSTVVVVHTFNPSTQAAEAGNSVRLRPIIPALI